MVLSGSSALLTSHLQGLPLPPTAYYGHLEKQASEGLEEREKKSFNSLGTGGVACKHTEHLLGLGGQRH